MALAGTGEAEYQLPLKNKEAKDSDKTEDAFAADKNTKIGKIVTKKD